MGGIYKIENIINNKIYIGSTKKSFKIRFNAHKNLLRRNKHENPILQNSWNKYGEDNFVFSVLFEFENISEKDLLLLEKKEIEKHKSNNRLLGYNICNVGKSRIGTKWSEESKKKRMGDGNPMFGKGHLRIGKLNPMFGKSLTKEHKQKMSKSLTGIKKPIIGEKLSKPVVQLNKNGNFVNEFKSFKEATEKTKILHIGEVCNGLRKTAGGYKWEWKIKI